MHMYACIGLSLPKPLGRSGPPRSGPLTGRRDRIAFYPSVQLFLLFLLSKLSRDRRYRTAPRMLKTFCQINSLGSRNRQTADVYAKSFGCHTSEKCARNSFGCHTCKIPGGGGQLRLTPPRTPIYVLAAGQCFCEEERN